ncbi:VOC family protein [Actinomadura nitritigenes]|uniref:VOC family protein n=1 Tax=Actinomadura nitritigenes TaxID=134602 RepID=UPI003D8C4C04
MPEMIRHAPGWPAWVDLLTPDLASSKAFYSELFGWHGYTLTTPSFGDYEIFTLGDAQGPEVAGMQELPDDTQASSWTCYFMTEDVRATLETIRDEGGQELIAPFWIADLGEMALCCDREGADFALWRPGNLRGAGVVDEPSSMCRVELACHDAEEARRFYGRVFGWNVAERQGPSRRTEWRLGEWPLGGLVSIDELRPHGLGDQAHWVPFFQVTDCDAAVARAARYGARPLLPATDASLGRYAVMADPVGAHLAVVAPPEP